MEISVVLITTHAWAASQHFTIQDYYLIREMKYEAEHIYHITVDIYCIL